MSVIAWDGKTLAADRQGTICDTNVTVSKIRKSSDGTILAWVDSHEGGMAMALWFEKGADPEMLPDTQNKDDWSRLITLLPNGQIFTYELQGIPLPILDPFAAWGAGRDFALGAMAMGADARKAVEIASKFNVYCGMGVEAFDFEIKNGKAARSLSKAYAMAQQRAEVNQ